jgi:tetratricopeptide (TPR) repeat protein
MRREAAGKLDDALKLYDLILELDDSNAVGNTRDTRSIPLWLTLRQGIWKRRVAVFKQLGDTKSAVEDLCAYLDTFYTDVEGWLELADLYASQYE